MLGHMISAMKQAKKFPRVKHSSLPEIFKITKEENLAGLEEKQYYIMMTCIELKTM